MYSLLDERFAKSGEMVFAPRR